MAKSQRTFSNTSIIIAALVLTAIPVTVALLGQQTNLLQHASELPDQAVANLNRGTEIISTINTDGTMGPQTDKGNWSNKLPAFLQGKLVFAVTDPIPAGKGRKTIINTTPGGDTTSPEPSEVEPTGTEGTGSEDRGRQNQVNGNQNGPQTVSALNITISKVEVHIASQEVITPIPSMAVQHTRPSISPVQSHPVPVDHWETLTAPSPATIDLVALAKGNTSEILGLTTLGQGRYTEVRLYVSSATATLEDGSSVNLEIQGKDNIVRVVRPFTVISDQTTTLTMDFDAMHSVIKAGSRYMLKPVIARLMESKTTSTP